MAKRKKVTTTKEDGTNTFLLEQVKKMYKSCYYCGLIIGLDKFPRECPKCNTHTRWQTKEQCLNAVVETEDKRWANIIL